MLPLRSPGRALERAALAAAILFGAGSRPSLAVEERQAAKREEQGAAAEDEIYVPLEEVDTSEVEPWEIHGRIDLTLAFSEGTNAVDGFHQADVLPLNPGLNVNYRFLRIFSAGAEVEWDGLEDEVELDRAFLGMEIDSHLRIRVGRDIVPFGIERHAYSPAFNPLVDRPAAFRAVFPGTFSDYGLFAGGVYKHPDGWQVGYEAALSRGLVDEFDGEGVTERMDDPNESPQFSGRLSFSPTETLTVGASYLVGNYDDANDQQLDFSGVDASYEFYGLRLRGEWVAGGVERPSAEGSDFHRHGWYLQALRRWELPWKIPRALETVFRFDEIDADSSVRDRLDLQRYSVGLNVEILENRLRLKTQLEWTDERYDDFANNAIYSQLELHW